MKQYNEEELILSIAIPTFNRASYLKENLKAILEQIESYKTIVEILVNDNASTDDTKMIVQNLSTKYNYPIKYHRLKKNVTSKENFTNVVSRAKGKYLFLLGDDDILSPNFLMIIIPLLTQNNNLGIIHFNRLSGDKNCSMNHLHDWIYDGATNIYNFKEFWLRVMSSPNFMSSIIIRKDCFLKGQAFVKDNYYGYEWFAQMCFGSIGEKCMYYYFPIVLMRNPPRSWSKEGALYFFVGLTNIFEDLNQYIPGINKAWKFRQKNTHFYDFYQSLPDIIKNKSINQQHINEFIKVITGTKDRIILYTLLFFSNIFLGKVARKLYFISLRLYRTITSQYQLLRKTSY